MRHVHTFLVLALLAWLGAGQASAEEKAKAPSPGSVTPTVLLRVPVAADEFASTPVARLDDEVIPLRELEKALGSAHEAMNEGGEAPRISPKELLDRIITGKLLVREARAMELDELPEFKQGIKSFSEQTLRQFAIDDLSKGAKVDPKAVEEYYRQEVKEYSLSSALFYKEEDAKQFEVDLKAGRKFEEVFNQARKDGKARGDTQPHWIKRKDLAPLLEEAAAKLVPGGVSAPVIFQYEQVKGFAVLRLEEVRYPEDPAARETAEGIVRSQARLKAFTEEKGKLVKKEVKFKQKLIDSLDFEAKTPGMAALLKDKRVLVEVKGEKPITVAELTAALQKVFFHGAEQAAGAKKVNKKKLDVLDGLLERKLLYRHALNMKFDKGEKYKELVEEQERSELFGLLIQKAVLPEVKVEEADVRAAYESRKAEFTEPEMVKLRSLAFHSPEQAQAAAEKLQRGADFNWTRANAEGRIDEDKTGATRFDGRALLVESLPKEFSQAISGAHPGDLRVGIGPDKFAYLLVVEDRLPAKEKPFEAVSGGLAQQVYGKKVQEAVETWADKLRAASKIEVYLVEGTK